jgi:hypothetical protein
MQIDILNCSLFSKIFYCIKFKLVITNGSETGELMSIDLPIGKVNTVNIGGEYYQILNQNTVGGLTLPSNTLLNRLRSIADPAPLAPSGSQRYNFYLGFQTPWRDWLSNINIPNVLYNSAQPQNNQNFKASNYSGVSGFQTVFVWDITFTTDTGVDTVYRKETFTSNITDFDTNGSAGFSGVVKLYDENGNQVTDISSTDNRIVEVEFPHSLGVVSASNIEGYIWIERGGSAEQPWFLHTSVDFTKLGHPLLPTNVSTPSNTQFVEVVSTSNLIKLRCKTDSTNLQDGVTYNIYGRTKNETAL